MLLRESLNKLENELKKLTSQFEILDFRSQNLGGNQRGHVNIVLSYLAVQPRTIDAQQVSGRLLVAASALQRLLDHKTLNIFERHVWRYVPAGTRRRSFQQRAIIKRQVNRLNSI